MTEQDPQSFRLAPGAISRGGEEKTVFHTDGVLLVDLESQPSAESWKPLLVDTPGFGGPLLPAQDDSLPPAPLPGLMYPNSR